jgi:hypothetical protein
MSKQSQTGLTGSRKIRRQAESHRLDALDEISTRCKRAIALAGLLEASGKHPQAEPLAAAMVTEVGFLILVEVRAMEGLLKIIWPEATR